MSIASRIDIGSTNWKADRSVLQNEVGRTISPDRIRIVLEGSEGRGRKEEIS